MDLPKININKSFPSTNRLLAKKDFIKRGKLFDYSNIITSKPWTISNLSKRLRIRKIVNIILLYFYEALY